MSTYSLSEVLRLVGIKICSDWYCTVLYSTAVVLRDLMILEEGSAIKLEAPAK